MITDGTRIPYVQSASSLQVPPPYHFPGVTVNAFVWEASLAPIREYCDRFFNLGSIEERGFVYKPAAFWPYAALFFVDYPVMISSNPNPDFGEIPYCDRGVVSQTEVFVALPVVRYGTSADTLLTHTEIECLLPFIVVGNSMSAVCGREMIGLGKLVAEIATGEGDFPESFHGSLSLPGWREERTGVMQEQLRFLEVTTGPTLPSFRTTTPQRSLATLLQSREAGWMMDSMTSISNFIDAATSGLLPTAMRTVGLKQYRDALDPERAIYQALVTCRSQYSNVRDFKFYDEKDVLIGFDDVGSFHEILQVFLDVGPSPSMSTVAAEPVAAFRFTADIDFDAMRVIHQYPIDGANGGPSTPARSDLAARWFRPWQGFFGPAQP